MHVDSSSYDIYIQNKTKQKHTIPKYSVLHQSQSQIFSPVTPDCSNSRPYLQEIKDSGCANVI